MSSMDVSSRGFPTVSPEESSVLPTGYHSRKARPPRSSGSSTGRAKTDQVVLEFLHKAAELIVQSRVNIQAEPDLQRGSRRTRFNLDIEGVPMVRDAMTIWRGDVRQPLAIDIYWDGARDDRCKVLLERWSVTFAAEGESSDAPLSSTQDVIQQLKGVCKRISVLLRALFSLMRQLPAHRLFAQSYPSQLSYTMHTAPASDATRAFEAQDVATSGYAFIPIATPFGMLKVAAVYRRDCDQFTKQQEQAALSRIFQDNFIIQDYVPGSPELVPASAPEPTTRTHLPTREMDLRPDSFVPVSDAEQFDGGDDRDLHIQRRRSSPRSIPMSIATPQQQFDSPDLVDDIRADDEVALRPQPSMSKPMAIPRVSSKGGIAAVGARDAGTAIVYREVKSDGNLIQHAHSYGGEDDVCLRGAAADPNVTAAPYGYGNVAIEREQKQSISLSLAFQQRQQQLWEGTDRQEIESGLRASEISSHDEPPTSNSNTSYHPLSTPPRHPKTVSLQQHDPMRRKISFNGAFVSEGAHSQCLTTAAGSIAKAEAITIPFGDARTDDMAMFSASPPFQANPCELLSTSPGYSYSKSRIQSGASNAPTFITTDQFQLGLHSVKGSTSASLFSVKKRGFLPDFGDSGVTAWGVSPDTPDSFGRALIGASTGGRPRLSLSGSAETGGASNAQGDDYFGDGSDLLLPFAIGDGSTTATTALDSQSIGTLNCSSRLETAAVGEFLHQLKNAPRLSRSVSAVSTSMEVKNSGKSSNEGSHRNPFQTSVFDEELAGFRSLRDELAQVI
ncbi:unnamed protein product [Peronospora destructor]|uniref:Autophagy-related protein 13 N-terminal domain-containing protein n=1 Tax=Peronospora destructor TaxID=86335 RepID=A0AAV0VDG8_9STRA|nr:unnamed protein product [Peronospora destructor]